MLDRVVLFKTRFFNSGWAHYETAKLGSLRLSPAESRVDELKHYFNAMEAMFLGTQPTFEETFKILATAEKALNK